MINVVDRVPTYPNRIKVTHADGTSEYVTWERADEPTVPGTPINKALFDSIVEDIGLNANKTVYVSTAGSDTLGDGTAANPYATITRAINSLPKNLNGYTATINIAAGTYNENVAIASTYGGVVILSGASGAAVQINSLQALHGANVQVANINLSVNGSINGNAIVVMNAVLMCFSPIASTGSVSYGVHVTQNGYAMFTDLTISNTSLACVYAVNASRVFAVNINASNNAANGLYAVYGAMIAYNTATITAAVAYATQAGGRIYSGAQASIPKY